MVWSLAALQPPPPLSLSYFLPPSSPPPSPHTHICSTAASVTDEGEQLRNGVVVGRISPPPPPSSPPLSPSTRLPPRPTNLPVVLHITAVSVLDEGEHFHSGRWSALHPLPPLSPSPLPLHPLPPSSPPLPPTPKPTCSTARHCGQCP